MSEELESKPSFSLLDIEPHVLEVLVFVIVCGIYFIYLNIKYTVDTNQAIDKTQPTITSPTSIPKETRSKQKKGQDYNFAQVNIAKPTTATPSNTFSCTELQPGGTISELVSRVKPGSKITVIVNGITVDTNTDFFITDSKAAGIDFTKAQPNKSKVCTQ